MPLPPAHGQVRTITSLTSFCLSALWKLLPLVSGRTLTSSNSSTTMRPAGSPSMATSKKICSSGFWVPDWFFWLKPQQACMLPMLCTFCRPLVLGASTATAATSASSAHAALLPTGRARAAAASADSTDRLCCTLLVSHGCCSLCAAALILLDPARCCARGADGRWVVAWRATDGCRATCMLSYRRETVVVACCCLVRSASVGDEQTHSTLDMRSKQACIQHGALPGH